MSSILAGGATKDCAVCAVFFSFLRNKKPPLQIAKAVFLLPAVYAFCDDFGDIFDIFFAPAFYPFGSNGKNSVKVKRHDILPFAFFKTEFFQNGVKNICKKLFICVLEFKILRVFERNFKNLFVILYELKIRKNLSRLYKNLFFRILYRDRVHRFVNVDVKIGTEISGKLFQCFLQKVVGVLIM